METTKTPPPQMTAEDADEEIKVPREETAGPTAADRTTEEVRQGRTGKHVRYILLASVVGAVIVLALVLGAKG